MVDRNQRVIVVMLEVYCGMEKMWSEAARFGRPSVEEPLTVPGGEGEDLETQILVVFEAHSQVRGSEHRASRFDREVPLCWQGSADCLSPVRGSL